MKSSLSLPKLAGGTSGSRLAKLLTRSSSSIARAGVTFRIVVARAEGATGLRKILHSTNVVLPPEDVTWPSIAEKVAEMTDALRSWIPRYGQPSFVQLIETGRLSMQELEQHFANPSSHPAPGPRSGSLEAGHYDVGVLYANLHAADPRVHEYIAARERELNIQRALKALPPSKITSSYRNLKTAMQQHPIFVGRPFGLITSDLVFYSRPAANLCDRLTNRNIEDNSTVWANDLRLAALIMVAGAEPYDSEADRQRAMLPLIEQLLHIQLSQDCGIPIEGQRRGRPMSFDAAETINLGDGQTRAFLCGIEFKKDGNQPGKALLQAQFTFQRLVAQRTTILDLKLSGGRDSRTRAHIEELARTARAVRETLEDLRALYQSLSPTTPNPRFCLPDPTPLPSNPFPRVQFTDRLRNDVTVSLFRAKVTVEDRQTPVVVKFCDSYGSKAHKMLAAKHYAPALIEGGVFPLKGSSAMMVIMDSSCNAIPAHDKYHSWQPLPPPIIDGVGKALEILHSAGYVHGDIRRENVLVPCGEGGQVMLVGLGLAGKEGDARYPPDWDPPNPPLEGALPGLKISKVHDLEMCKRLSHVS